MESFLASLQVNVSARRETQTPRANPPRAALQNGARFLYRNVAFLLVCALACLFFYSPLLLIGLLFIPVIFFARWFALGSPFPHTRANVIVLVFLSAVLWSILRAADVHGTVLTTARLLGGVAVMFVIADYADHPGRLWNVAALLAASGVAIAFGAPFVTEPSPDKMFNFTFLFQPERFPFEESNPNMVAGTLAALLPLATALVLGEEKRLRVFGAVAVAPMLLMLFLLQARGAWFAALGGILLFLSLYKRILIGLLPLAILAIVLFSAFGEEIRALSPIPLLNVQVAPSLEGRRVVWDFAAREIVREPFGHGLDSFKSFADNRASDILSEPQRQNAHNLFLQAGFETGLVGLGAFAALFAYALYASWHAVVRDVKRYLAIGVFAALCAAFASDVLEANMWGNKAAFWLWALFGMAVVFGRYGARRRRTLRGKSLESS